jgi:hypothetical protein
MIYHYRLGTCHYPRVHGITVMVNSIFNGWRFKTRRSTVRIGSIGGFAVSPARRWRRSSLTACQSQARGSQ